MILVTRLNDEELYVNPHQIEFIEEKPDTVIKMVSDRKLIVKESCKEILSRIIDYRRKIGIMGNEID